MWVCCRYHHHHIRSCRPSPCHPHPRIAGRAQHPTCPADLSIAWSRFCLSQQNPGHRSNSLLRPGHVTSLPAWKIFHLLPLLLPLPRSFLIPSPIPPHPVFSRNAGARLLPEQAFFSKSGSGPGSKCFQSTHRSFYSRSSCKLLRCCPLFCSNLLTFINL